MRGFVAEEGSGVKSYLAHSMRGDFVNFSVVTNPHTANSSLDYFTYSHFTPTIFAR